MDFDHIKNRQGEYSMKWDGMAQNYNVNAQDALAMWVADMDFEPPQSVKEALEKRLEHNIYGYFYGVDGYQNALKSWVKRRHGFDLPDCFVNTHGLVQGVGLCLEALTEKGDGVIVFSPVYHAFGRTIRAAGRELIESPLVEKDGQYHMDLDGLEQSLQGHEKLVIFCSPHNPSGRVWSVEEIKMLSAFCEKHNLLIISDEIHMDLVYKGHRHHVFGDAAPEASERLIYLMSATKSFNVAGALTGSIITANSKLHEKIQQKSFAWGIGPNLFGMIACQAAYEGGDEWMDACTAYIEGNYEYFHKEMNALKGVYSMPMASTYLAWVNFSGLGIGQAELLERVEQTAQIAANHGESFGKGGEGWLRFNLATSRGNVEKAVERLKAAFADIQ